MSSVEEYIVAKPAIVSADTDVYEVVHLILSNQVSGFRFQGSSLSLTTACLLACCRKSIAYGR